MSAEILLSQLDGVKRTGSRELFVDHRFMTAVVNAPSDRLPNPALDFFRNSSAHAEDVWHVIAIL